MRRLAIVLSIWLLPTVLCITKDFKIYWNVPTDNCHKFGLNFAVVHDKFGIVQNVHDTINGDKVVILYRPGLYPYLEIGADENVTEINGGIPQKVNMKEHLAAFEKDLNDVVLPDFSGLGMISYENWRPIFHQNHNSYKQLSIDNMPETLDAEEREKMGKQLYEEKAKAFLLETMAHAKKLRPNARWSFHDFHNCFNFRYQEDEATCPPEDETDNDAMSWMWKAQDFMNPLMWVGASWTKERAMHRIAMTTNEAKRLVKRHNPEALVIPYLTLSPESGRFIVEDIAVSIIKQMIDYEADGVFIWEDANEFNTKELCQKYLDYMKNVFGLAAHDALNYFEEQNQENINISAITTAQDVSQFPSIPVPGILPIECLPCLTECLPCTNECTPCNTTLDPESKVPFLTAPVNSAMETLSCNTTQGNQFNLTSLMASNNFSLEKIHCEPCRDNSRPTCQPLHVVVIFAFVCMLRKL